LVLYSKREIDIDVESLSHVSEDSARADHGAITGLVNDRSYRCFGDRHAFVVDPNAISFLILQCDVVWWLFPPQ
jgi:hypothetical protein